MGQTLTHGIYLPDEGERNCYNGLAGNWQLLDGAVGTVAEHTNQIAGKASASHTHGNITNDGKVGTTANLPLITGTGGVVQAGSFGTAANTFCEGNDSRLSDARTPVAHTHTKSDVTDLLNSNFIPSANNSYDLGSSSYQWNNLYAKNYYYNGTAWGLDQANVWTGRQTYGAYLKSFGEARTDEWSSNSRTNAYLLSRRDTDDVSGFLISTFRSNQAQGTAGHIYGWDILENSTRYSGLRFTIDWDSTLNSGNGAYKVTLGTNTQGTNPCNDLHITQLKTINDINPGALSLPSSHYVEIGTDRWDLTGATYNRVYINNANPTFPGILFIRINSTTATDILVRLFTTSGQEISYVGSKMEAGSNNMIVTVPCPPSTNIYVSIKTSSTIYTCRYYTLLGDPEFDSRSGS